MGKGEKKITKIRDFILFFYIKFREIKRIFLYQNHRLESSLNHYSSFPCGLCSIDLFLRGQNNYPILLFIPILLQFFLSFKQHKNQQSHIKDSTKIFPVSHANLHFILHCSINNSSNRNEAG